MRHSISLDEPPIFIPESRSDEADEQFDGIQQNIYQTLDDEHPGLRDTDPNLYDALADMELASQCSDDPLARYGYVRAKHESPDATFTRMVKELALQATAPDIHGPLHPLWMTRFGSVLKRQPGWPTNRTAKKARVTHSA